MPDVDKKYFTTLTAGAIIINIFAGRQYTGISVSWAGEAAKVFRSPNRRDQTEQTRFKEFRRDEQIVKVLFYF